MSSFRTLRVTLALTTLLASGGGCALIVGDVQGTLTFSDDAGRDGATTKDAAKDQAAARDSTSNDAKKASDVTAPDTGQPADTGGADVSALHDAGHDASMPEDAGHDAGHDGGHDAGPPPPFCVNLVVPDGTVSYCDDFDENSNLAAAFETKAQQIVQGGHPTLKVGGDASYSAPNALYAQTIAVDGGQVGQACLGLPIGGMSSDPYTSFTLDFEILVTTIGKGAVASQIGGFSFGSPTVLINVTNTPDAGAGDYSFTVTESASLLIPHNTIPVKAGWTHVVLTIEPVMGKLKDTLYLNGTMVESLELQPSFTTTGGCYGYIGWQYAVGSVHQAWFDNIAFSFH